MKDRIASIILETGNLKKDFAAKLRISPQYITKLLAGERKLSPRMAESIEKEFGYSAHWILTGEGEPKARREEPKPEPVSERKKQSLDRLSALDDNILEAMANLADEINVNKK